MSNPIDQIKVLFSKELKDWKTKGSHFYIESLSKIPGTTLVVMGAFWVDCVGDSTCEVAGIYNLKPVMTQECEPAANMTVTSHVYDIIDSQKEAAILVVARNGEDDLCITMYKV